MHSCNGGCIAQSDAVDAVDRPERSTEREDVPRDELQWREIGSGMWARTFLDMDRLVLTSRSGPAACDIARRFVRHLGTGKIIDDCDPDVEADERVFRRIEPGTHYRVELITKNASKWFHRIGPDIAELNSPPRIVQEAGLREYGGRKLKPGWSLDLTVDDPETKQPWDLSDGKVRSKARELIKYGKPYMVI